MVETDPIHVSSIIVDQLLTERSIAEYEIVDAESEGKTLPGGI